MKNLRRRQFANRATFWWGYAVVCQLQAITGSLLYSRERWTFQTPNVTML